MPTDFVAFPIQGRKTSEMAEGNLIDDSFLIHWPGTPSENLKRIGLVPFMNHIAKYLTATPELLTGAKEVQPTDTFIQILNSNGAARTVSVYDGVSCLVHNSPTSDFIITVEGTPLLANESAFVFWDPVNAAHIVVKMAGSGGGGGSSFLEITQTDLTDATYYFYGGVDQFGAWHINRYLKADLTVKTTANQVSNPSQTTLGAAWANRGTLSYS